MLRIYNKEDVLSVTNVRRFETKVGERILLCSGNLEESLLASKAKYVLLGIPESIGVKANEGVGGAETAWLSFLKAFLNVQSNEFFTGEEVMLLGHLDFNDLNVTIEKLAPNHEERVDAYRHAVNAVDEMVEKVVKQITSVKKIPILIGGGHNNAYPNLKGTAKGWHKAGVLEKAQINCVNLDAHADYRPAEGRHSGNGFRYAMDEGFLKRYGIIGLHQNYIQQNVLLEMEKNFNIDFLFYEDIFIHEQLNLRQACAHMAEFTDDTLVGIELDLDSIENVLTSASSPTGMHSIHARQYINFMAMHIKPAYLHICEGATQLIDGRGDASTGKLISYLVTDFIKA
jgi:formiminoglutamase